MYQNSTINSRHYFETTKLLRTFFESRGFIEVATQPRLSILAACEDPSTITTFDYQGQKWPLKQTGQMDLEYELLTNCDYEGVYCLSTSYRQELNPIPGRHELIFPMFEFEGRGDFKDLISLEKDLLDYMEFPRRAFGQFKAKTDYIEMEYKDIAKMFGTKELTAEDETRIWEEISPVVFMKNFPEYTSPFWNMKRSGPDSANKVDTILYGMETLGSAERETDSQIMYDRFHSISDGGYAGLLYKQFGRERVERELDAFLNLPMGPRFGGGIGMTRMIRAYLLAGEQSKKMAI